LGILVNAVAPSMMDTPANRNAVTRGSLVPVYDQA
jgi:hypothetical protein